jgi:hypothetical protein
MIMVRTTGTRTFISLTQPAVTPENVSYASEDRTANTSTLGSRVDGLKHPQEPKGMYTNILPLNHVLVCA